MLILSVLKPRTLLGWILWGVFFLLFIPLCGHLVQSGMGVTCLFVLAALFFTIAFAIPPHVLMAWFRLPSFPRGVLAGFIAYVILVTLGNLDELYTLRLWGDFLFLRGATPATSSHALAVVGGFIAWGAFGAQFESQPEDTEVPVGPRRLISFEEAKEKLERAFSKKK